MTTTTSTARLLIVPLLAALTACAGDTTALTFGELQGPNSGTDGVTSTVVLVRGSDSVCSGTVIGPRAVLTAAHCVGRFSELRIGSSVGPRATGCVVHPNALDDGSATIGCSALNRSDLLVHILQRHDMAVLFTGSDLALPQRAISAPRTCVDQTVLFRTRGYASSFTRRRLDIEGTPQPDGRLATTALDVADEIDPGDSGGTWTELDRDVAGPVVAVTSAWVPALGVGTMTFLWTGTEPGVGTNIDWLWRQIRDNPARCVLGTRTAGAPPSAEPACLVRGVVQLDSDGDGLPDSHDLCPYLDGRDMSRAPHTSTTSGSVTGQHDDLDRDFIGDDCDPTPGACQWVDADDDRVLDFEDNCPVANPLQENCNADAEAAVPGTPVRGDACDPTPCASGASVAAVTASTVTSTSFDGVGVGANLTGEPRGIGTTTTGFRWCPCDLAEAGDTQAWRTRCRTERTCSVDQFEYVRSGSPWRSMATTFASPHVRSTAGEISLGSDQPYHGTWGMVSDATAAGVLRSLVLPSIRLRDTTAVLWSTPRAWADVKAGIPTWCTAGTAAGCATLPVTLGGHYWSGTFTDDRRDTGGFVPDGTRAPTPDFFSFDMCPECLAAFPDAFLARGALCSTPPCEVYERFAEPGKLPNGGDVPVTARLESALVTDLATQSWEWTRSQAPNDTLDVDAVRAIALSRAGTSTRLRSVVRSPLSSGPDYGQLPTPLVTAPLAEVGLYASILPLVDGDGQVAYFVGGRRSDTTLNPAIQVVDLRSGAQRRIVLGRAWQGDVVAAALDPFRDRVVAIERSTSAYRIVSIVLGTGEVAVAATFPDTASSASHSIVPLPDGRFAISSSRTGSILTRVVLVDFPAETLTARVSAATSERLTGSLGVTASRQGITLAARPSASGGWRPVGITYAVFKAATSGDLASLF